jgi:hypothetical protein
VRRKPGAAASCAFGGSAQPCRHLPLSAVLEPLDLRIVFGCHVYPTIFCLHTQHDIAPAPTRLTQTRPLTPRRRPPRLRRPPGQPPLQRPVRPPQPRRRRRGGRAGGAQARRARDAQRQRRHGRPLARARGQRPAPPRRGRERGPGRRGGAALDRGAPPRRPRGRAAPRPPRRRGPRRARRRRRRRQQHGRGRRRSQRGRRRARVGGRRPHPRAQPGRGRVARHGPDARRRRHAHADVGAAARVWAAPGRAARQLVRHGGFFGGLDCLVWLLLLLLQVAGDAVHSSMRVSPLFLPASLTCVNRSIIPTPLPNNRRRPASRSSSGAPSSARLTCSRVCAASWPPTTTRRATRPPPRRAGAGSPPTCSCCARWAGWDPPGGAVVGIDSAFGGRAVERERGSNQPTNQLPPPPPRPHYPTQPTPTHTLPDGHGRPLRPQRRHGRRPRL